MKIEILGSGCAKCVRTEKNISDVVKELGLDAQVIHITDLDEIMRRGVMITPCVYVNDKRVSEGRVPTRKVILGWFGH